VFDYVVPVFDGNGAWGFGGVIILDWSFLLYIYIPQLSFDASAWRAALEYGVVCQEGRSRSPADS
jgi:hypothetical protein